MKTVLGNKLLPCPFCGEKGLVWEGIAPGDYKKKIQYTPACSNRHCIANSIDATDLWFETKQEAIDAWNRRPKDE